MNQNYLICSLGSVISLNPSSINKDYPYKEIEYIDISSVGNGILNNTTIYDIHNAPGRAKRLVLNGDTILSTVRPNRRSFFYIKNPKINMVVSTGFAVLRPSDKIDLRFLYYTVTNQSFTDYLSVNAKGSAYPAVDTDTIARAQIKLPLLSIQHKIASVLSTYDDLIENNTRRIKILEEIAQTIYCEWFVKFRFPGHEKVKMVDSPMGKIPEGWEVKKLGDVCKVIPGYAFKSKYWRKEGTPVIKIKNINDDNTINIEEVDYVPPEIIKTNLKKYFIKTGDMLIAMTGATAGKIGKFRSRTQMLLNQRVAKIVPEFNYYEFIYYKISNEESQKRFFALADGAAQPNMSGSQIENITLILPPLRLSNYFSDIVRDLISEVDNLFFRNMNLRRTRDLLLPKLISGELNVSDIDIKVNGLDE